MNNDSSHRFTLRDLSLAPRLVIAVFLVSVGFGYLSALVQLHFQHASEGQIFPGRDEAIKNYHGNNLSQIERLLTAPESQPFNGHGTMVPAFTFESPGWKADVHAEDEAKVRGQRLAERDALLDWVRNRVDQKAYDEDSYPISPEMADKITRRYVIKPGDPPPPTQMTQLLTKPETAVLGPAGSMVSAFTRRSSNWKSDLKAAQKEHREQDLRREREGERLALLSWTQSGPDKVAYEKNSYLLPPEIANQAITAAFLVKDADGNPVKPPRVMIQTLLTERCVRCHAAGGGANDKAMKCPLETFESLEAYCVVNNPQPTPPQPQVKIRTLIQDRCVRCHAAEESVNDRAAKAPLDTYDRFKAYATPATSGGMPLRGLAQTTHVHLLGFSMLFALTGLVFSFTSYPFWSRALFGPLTLVAQLVDISCWWLGRLDPLFAQVILVTGGLVALGLLIQIVGSLLNLFGSRAASSADSFKG